MRSEEAYKRGQLDGLLAARESLRPNPLIHLLGVVLTIVGLVSSIPSGGLGLVLSALGMVILAVQIAESKAKESSLERRITNIENELLKYEPIDRMRLGLPPAKSADSVDQNNLS